MTRKALVQRPQVSSRTHFQTSVPKYFRIAALGDLKAKKKKAKKGGDKKAVGEQVHSESMNPLGSPAVLGPKRPHRRLQLKMHRHHLQRMKILMA